MCISSFSINFLQRPGMQSHVKLWKCWVTLWRSPTVLNVQVHTCANPSFNCVKSTASCSGQSNRYHVCNAYGQPCREWHTTILIPSQLCIIWEYILLSINGAFFSSLSAHVRKISMCEGQNTRHLRLFLSLRKYLSVGILPKTIFLKGGMILCCSPSWTAVETRSTYAQIWFSRLSVYSLVVCSKSSNTQFFVDPPFGRFHHP